MAEKAIELYNKIEMDDRLTHNIFSHNGKTLKYLIKFIKSNSL